MVHPNRHSGDRFPYEAGVRHGFEQVLAYAVKELKPVAVSSSDHLGRVETGNGGHRVAPQVREAAGVFLIDGQPSGKTVW